MNKVKFQKGAQFYPFLHLSSYYIRMLRKMSVVLKR